MCILSISVLIMIGCGQTTNKQTETVNDEEIVIEQNTEKSASYLPYLITNFQPYNNTIHADSILFINETCLIEVWPEGQDFEDENSEEAQDYYTAMDDWCWYIAETREKFKKMGIKSVVAKRYLSFTLTDNKKILVDTKKEQNGESVSALLYKKGHIPMFIWTADHDLESITDYLQK